MGVRRRIRLALQRFGVDIRPKKPPTSELLRFGRVLQAASIDLILDIGANDGSFALDARRSGYKGDILSFEPLPTAHQRLEEEAAHDGKWRVGPRIALGREEGETVIHVASNSVSSSLLPMAQEHKNADPESAYIADQKILVRRLDDVVAELVPDLPGRALMLKVDTQGYELPILEGSKALLEQARIVEVELSLTELYEGQALIWDVIEFLRSRDFELWMMSEVFVNEQTGRLLQVDGLFVRKGAIA
jgi:FkbM family methyltransferase